MRRVGWLVLGVVWLGLSPWALAEEPGGQAAAGEAAKVTAEDLFQQGMELFGKGKYAEAAEKLEESNRLDRAAGTTVNLADCYERMGRVASAWTLFVEARAIFERRSPPDPRAVAAKDRAEALYPKLSRLTIEVPEAARVNGLVVKRDGLEVGKAQFGTGIAVDPGRHVIEASAPGKKTWKGEVEVKGEAAKVSTSVPVLEDAPADSGAAGAGGAGGAGGVGGSGPGGAARPGGESGQAWPWQRKVAIGAAGAGVAGVVVGAIFGADSLGKHDALAQHCDPGTPRVCDAEGIAIGADLRTSATVSTVGFAVGGALVAAGVVLWLVAPSGESAGQEERATGGAKGAESQKGKKKSTGVWIAPQVGSRTGVTAGVAW